MSDFAQVAENVCVGGWSAARDYGNQFDVIVNVAVDAPNFGQHQFELVDGPGNKQSEFDAAVSCVQSAIESGSRVLVHCVAGRSRSVVVAAAAISRARNMPFDVALGRVRLVRNCEPHQPHTALLQLAEAIV